MHHFEKITISCAVTGEIRKLKTSPHLPVTAEEITQEATDVANAVVGIVHIHNRDEESSEPTANLDLFREVTETIQDQCYAVILGLNGSMEINI